MLRIVVDTNIWIRIRKQIDPEQVEKLIRQMRLRGEFVELVTIPPRCRDPKDDPVLTTAIDGKADAIVTGDDELRVAMMEYGVKLWGIQSLFDALESP